MSDQEVSEANTQRPLILALDTSSRLTSLALARGQQVMAILGTETSERRSERLWDQVDFLLGEAAVAIRDVELFAACVGPGGFTGLRVGIAAVKGFASATGKPSVGVTSLEAVAFSAREAQTVCAVINAYRDEVYSQMFSFGEDRMPIGLGQPQVAHPKEVVRQIPQDAAVVFAGDGAAAVFANLIDASASWSLAETPVFLAEHVARLAFLKFLRGSAEGSLRASYVRPAEAEVKLSLGLLKPQGIA